MIETSSSSEDEELTGADGIGGDQENDENENLSSIPADVAEQRLCDYLVESVLKGQLPLYSVVYSA